MQNPEPFELETLVDIGAPGEPIIARLETGEIVECPVGVSIDDAYLAALHLDCNRQVRAWTEREKNIERLLIGRQQAAFPEQRKVAYATGVVATVRLDDYSQLDGGRFALALRLAEVDDETWFAVVSATKMVDAARLPSHVADYYKASLVKKQKRPYLRTEPVLRRATKE